MQKYLLLALLSTISASDTVRAQEILTTDGLNGFACTADNIMIATESPKDNTVRVAVEVTENPQGVLLHFNNTSGGSVLVTCQDNTMNITLAGITSDIQLSIEKPAGTTISTQ
jgi:hypothetical protein